MEVRGRKGRDKPKKRWENCVNQDLDEKKLSGHEIQNRAASKRLTRNAGLRKMLGRTRRKRFKV
jgi:hypothetical protein